MIIHLAGSGRNPNDLPYLRQIVQTVYENDCVLARDWIEAAYHRVVTKKIKDEDVDWEEVMATTMDSISRADVVIVECSNYNFTQGYQAAISLERKKPTLMLSREPIKGRSLSGIKSRLLTLKNYKTDADIQRIVSKFIQDHKISSKDLRFNFFIDRPIYNYLRIVSDETGKNKSEIIRELIEREIKKMKD